MKKKKRSVLACGILFVAVLLLHYGKVVFSKTNPPHLEWVIERGDAELIKDLHIAAQVGNGDVYSNVQLSSTGTQSGKHPLFHSYYTEQPLAIEYLQNRFSSFMRGKDRHPMNFVESIERVFYIEDYMYNIAGENPQQSISIAVSILDKETNEEIKRELVLEADSPIYYAYVQNVLTSGPYLIFEMTLSKERNNATMLYVYDWRKDEMVAEFNKDGDTMHSSDLEIHGFDGGDAEQFLAIETIYLEPTSQEEYESSEWEPQIQRGFTLYDIHQNTAHMMSLPEIFQHEAAQFLTKNEEIYLILFEEGELHIIVYDVVKQEIALDKKIPIGTEPEKEGRQFLVKNVEDNLLLMESGITENVKIDFWMLDTDELNVLVEGHIQGNSDTEVFIDQIYFE